MARIRTLYDWLEVEETASSDEIKKAYRKLALLHHPDRGGNEDHFHKIQQAHTTLMDDEKRAAYDKKVAKVRFQVRLRGIRDGAFSKIRSIWESEVEQESVRQNRKNSQHADYFAEQERLEAEWQDQFRRMMSDYRSQERFNASNLEEILRSTDELLDSFVESGKVRFSGSGNPSDGIDLGVQTTIDLSDQVQDTLTDLRDTIVKAERLVRIFNKLTS